MGAWRLGRFDNDDAANWLAEFERGGLAAVRVALSVVTTLKVTDALEAPEATSAELIAAARDGYVSRLPLTVFPGPGGAVVMSPPR